MPKQKQLPQTVSTELIYGKVPPHAKDLEMAVLGAILLEKNAFELVHEILKPECFYFESHQKIFHAMDKLFKIGEPIDMLTVSEALKKSKELESIGGGYYVVSLTNAVVSSANIESHSRILLEKFMQRELIRMCGNTIQSAYDDNEDVFDMMEAHEKEFTGLSTGNIKKSAVALTDAIVKVSARIVQLREQPSHVTGIPSGFAELDRVTHGWQATDLIILAARPSVGKTAFALNLARNAALNFNKKTAVAFFSLEMSTGQLVNRLLSIQSNIWLERITNGSLSDEEMKDLTAKGMMPLADVPIFIDDSPALNVYELRARIRRLKRKENIGLVIIDYLQLMSGTGENRNTNREQEISKISRDLKSLAKELEIPIIALSQLSRKPEERRGTDKMPQLSDLRESGAIEQDADLVMFMYRPEYYDANSAAIGESTAGETHLRIAKHRNGKLEIISLTANLSIQKFYDLKKDVHVSGSTNGKTNGWQPVIFNDDETNDAA